MTKFKGVNRDSLKRINRCPAYHEGQCFQLGTECVYKNPKNCGTYWEIINHYQKNEHNLELSEAQERAREMARGLNRLI